MVNMSAPAHAGVSVGLQTAMGPEVMGKTYMHFQCLFPRALSVKTPAVSPRTALLRFWRAMAVTMLLGGVVYERKQKVQPGPQFKSHVLAAALCFHSRINWEFNQCPGAGRTTVDNL